MEDLTLSNLLQNNLQKLSACVGDRGNEQAAVGPIADLVTSIHQSCTNQRFKEKSKASICSHIFDETYGILKFLRDILLWNDEYKTVKSNCFLFLDDVLDITGSHSSAYGPDIKDICLKYLKNPNNSASVKRASLITLSKVLELCKDSNVDSFNINGIMEDMILQLGLTSKFKLSATVKEVVLSILGVIAHYYPNEFKKYSARVLKIYIGELRLQMDSKARNIESRVILGCLDGLREYLFNFSVSHTENEVDSRRIFEFTMKALMQQNDLALNKSGLRILAEHSRQFSAFVYEDAQGIYTKIESLLVHKNRDLSKAAFTAIITVLKQVAEILSTKLNEDKTSEIHIFNFFMQSFKGTFQKRDHSKLLTVAAVGCGLFAKACKVLINESEVKNMMKNITQRCEHLFFVSKIDIEETITLLPSFLEALAGIVAQLNMVPKSLLFSLEKLVVFQIDNYPYIPSSHRFLAPIATIKILLSLQPKVDVFKGFLSHIVYQSIVRTCSHSLLVDLELQKDKEPVTNIQEISSEDMKLKIITYKNYITFWKSFFNFVHSKEITSLCVPLAERQSLKESIYDEILSNVIGLFYKLDLSVGSSTDSTNQPTDDDKDSSDVFSDPVHGVLANNISDCKIFINLVDFCRDFLKENGTDLFGKWVYSFAKETIFFSTKHPLISGFYKLVSLNLNICSEIDYFQGSVLDTDSSSDILVESQKCKECDSSLHLFSKFSKEVLVRCQQFKDDLLASCLLVLLSLPSQIIQLELPNLIPALKSTFKLGLSYLPLAEVGLNTLERWCKVLPPETMKTHYMDILPLLNPYLLASRFKDEKTSKTISKSKSSMVKSHKMSAKKANAEVIEESEMMKVQEHIVHFLGSIGGEFNKAMLESAFEKAETAAIAWDSTNREHLKYPVPFVDLKPEICLDDFLPRVLELATTSSDQQIKVVACEVLHSLVLYIVGHGYMRPESMKDKWPMQQLYKHLFPGLLLLACDVNQVAKQLFNPLVLQLIHWFTHCKVIHSPESQAILLALWDGATHQQNAALRDFSALCLKEYFTWTLKQASKDRTIYVKHIFEKLSSFARHPNSFKRLGAGLVFNNIYQIFREEQELVDIYALELLVHFVESLAIAHEDDKLLGTQKVCSDALDHLKRICVRKSLVFASSNKGRHHPVCLEEADMKSLVMWLFHQCGVPQTECRHKCMELATEFSVLVSGVHSVSEYVKNYMASEDISKSIFEQRLIDAGVPPEKTTYTTSKTAIIWLEALVTSLECYNWAFLKNLLTNDDEAMYSCTLLEGVKFFIQDIALNDLNEVIKHFTYQKSEEWQFTPQETLDFNWIKCTTLVRLYDIFITISTIKSSHSLVKRFLACLWNKETWGLIITSVINPSSLGFDISDSGTSKNLHSVMLSVLKTSECQQTDFKQFCSEYLTSSNNNFASLISIDLNDAETDYLQLYQPLVGYETLINSDVWPYPSDVQSNQELSCKVLDHIFDGLTDMQSISNNPQSLELAKKMLFVCDAIGIKPAHLVSKLFDTTPVENKMTNRATKKGIAVFSHFDEQITKVMCKMSTDVISKLVEQLRNNPLESLLILTKFLTNVAANRELRKLFGVSILKSLMHDWKKFWELCKSEEDNLDSVLSVIEKMILIDSEVALNVFEKYAVSLLSTYLGILKKPETKSNYIIQALDLLPFFVSSANAAELKSCIESIIVSHFPISCHELDKGSTLYNNYSSAVKKLLSALELTGSDVLLESLTILFCKEENHIMQEDFDNCLSSLIKCVPANRHQKLVEAAFLLTRPENSTVSYSSKFNIMDHVCLTLLKGAALSAFINFYVAHIVSIMEVVKQRKTYILEQKNSQLVAKIGAFKLMELLYSRLKKDQLHSVGSQVVAAYVGGLPENGKELTQDITKYALEFRKENVSLENVSDWCRRLCCACFNTVIAVVSCTQTELKFYQGFIFKENFDKGERIWENIVDVNKQYQFDIELDVPLVRKKKFVSIRHHARNPKEIDVDESEVESSLHMMASENLNMSSLAEDVSKFDFSTTEQIFSSEKKTALLREEDKSLKTEKETAAYVELEADELNQHECMAQLTFLLRHMESLGLIPSEQEETLPSWLKGIIDTLENSIAPINVKLLLGRVITSNFQILKVYAKHLLKPMMNLIVSNALGCEMNYYILDVIVALLSWAPEVVPEGVLQCHDASALLRFLIEKCSHTRRDIFRNNLEVIKTTLECWKDKVDLPYKSIFDKMKISRAESKDSIVGVQLLGVVLLSNLPPFPSSTTEQMGYLNLLISNLDHKYKEVYAAAAEVIGLIIKQSMQSISDIKEDLFYRCVLKKFSYFRDQKKHDKFLTCLHIVHGYCSCIVHEFVPNLIFMQPKMYGIYQNYILEMLGSCVKDIENGYEQLKSIQLFKDIEHKEETIQYTLLQTLERIIVELSCDEILDLLPTILNIQLQPAVQCRQVLYKITMLLYDKYSLNDGAKQKAITRLCQEILLKALADPETTLKLIVDNFWSNDRLPSDTKGRLLSLIKIMYSPPTEESFLQYATFLLLERTSHSPDYKRSIFPHPLTECNFTAYRISTSWRQRYAAMTPLFVDSYSQGSSMSSFEGVAKSSADNMVKATQQAAEFSATADFSSRGSTFNWLTDSTMDTFEDSISISSTSFSPKKSHLLSVKNVKKARAIIDSTASTSSSKPQTTSQPEQKGGKERSSIWYLRKRFVKDRKRDSNVFARMELRRKDVREERFKEQQKRREAEVTMYRQYRIGDLPDIQIPNSAVIAPLQALAEKDAIVAKLLFKSLVIAVCNLIKTEEEPTTYETYAKDLSLSLVSVLEKSTENVSTVISFCLETLHHIDLIPLEADTIYTSSLKSNQQSIGILLLESCINQAHSAEPRKKRQKLLRESIEETTAQWIKLAGLHKSLDEYDMVNGIFSHIMGGEENCSKALQLEANGQYAEALEIYGQLYAEILEAEKKQAEKDFLESSLHYCLDRLTKWDELESNVVSCFNESEEPDLQKVWDHQYFIDNYLHYMIKSKIKCLMEGKNKQCLLTFIDNVKEYDDRRTHIEDHFFEELSLLHIIQENYNAARHYNSVCFSKFFKEWKSLSCLAVNLQMQKLQNLQKYVEMEEFLDLFETGKTLQNFSTTDSASKLLELWEKRLPSIVDPPNVWDDIVANRRLYIKKFEQACVIVQSSSSNRDSNLDDSPDMDVDLENVSKIFQQKLVSFKLKFVNYCTIQENMPVALMHLKQIHKNAKNVGGQQWSEFIEAFSFAHFKKSQKSSGESRLKALLTSRDALEKLKAKQDLTPSQHSLESQIMEAMSDGFSTGEFLSLRREIWEQVVTISGSDDVDEVSSVLQQKSFDALNSVISSLKTEYGIDHSADNSKQIASGYMNLANFCNKYLREHESGDKDVAMLEDAESSYPSMLVESLLCAMRYGDPQARQFFPRLLQVVELYPDVVPIFKKNVVDIPCWMFIGWINQMIALLDKPIASVVQGIIENIVKQYPNAIIYSFHLSCEGYEFPSTSEGKKNKAFVERMSEILKRNRLIIEFVGALQHLSVPHVIFKDYMRDFASCLEKQPKNKEEILYVFKKMWTNLFDIESFEDNSQSLTVGPIQLEFAEKYKKDIIKTCGEDGQKLLTANPKGVKECFINIVDSSKNDDSKFKTKPLASFSPWLSEFQSWKHSTQIEIPGQYSGKSKPLPAHHVKISGFDSKVLVLSSVTCPRRITIRGNDEKEYNILVKAGEDLRQDSRIEQLFSVMNEIYENDPQCKQRHLKIVTYRVVPLTSKIGIIEWVDNTVVLQQLLVDSMSSKDKKAFNSGVCSKKVRSYVKKPENEGFNPYHFYMQLHQKFDAQQAVSKFQDIVSLIPEGLFKTAFLKLSTSPEAYLRLRSQFAVSHAVLSISQWLLGIGDRHASNFLIDLSSGREIGIDFGHAFGSATQFLQVPELVPFRLTPQYLQLTAPLREKGIFEATMVHALTALRKNYHQLLNIMDVFIKEPTVDWKANAARQIQKMGLSQEEAKSDVDWYPKQRVNMALKKLKGANPSHIMREELFLGHSHSKFFETLESACKGDPERNIRAKFGETGLSAEEQVSCLIDQATDPNILLKTYYGWNPWL